jgi:hypothetical protein
MEQLKQTTKIFGLDFPGKMVVQKKAMFEKNKYDTLVEYEGNFFDYFKFVTSDTPALATGLNEERFKHHIFADSYDDNQFKGGTLRDVIEPHKDFTVFHDAVKKISSNKLWKKMAHSFDMTSTRKRVRSAYDGDYDHDKRYDMEPFSRREIKPSIARIVRIRIDASFNCGVGAEQINRFGGFVAAIINLMERNGFLAELHVSHTGYNFMYCEGSSLMRNTLLVKKADEYMPPSKVLKVLSSVWYRRAGFSMIVAAAEICGNKVGDGLGTPYRYSKVWEKIGNEIHIYSAPSSDEQNGILEKLIELVGERK